MLLFAVVGLLTYQGSAWLVGTQLSDFSLLLLAVEWAILFAVCRQYVLPKYLKVAVL